MRLRGCVEPVYPFGGDRDSRIETECQVRAADVVIDRLRYSYDRHTVLEKSIRDAECAVATYHYQAIDIQAFEIGDRLFRNVPEYDLTLLFPDGVFVRIGRFRGAEYRPAEGKDTRDVVI